jgi:hypothetical protein
MPEEKGSSAAAELDGARDATTRLAALDALFEKLEEIEGKVLAAAEPAELLEAVKTSEVVVETALALRACAPSEAAARVSDHAYRPLLSRLSDELAHKRSFRQDGSLAKPADYALSDSIWKAILAAVADVLICARMSREDTKAWLAVRLVKFPVGPGTVIDWRDQTVARSKAGPQPEGKPLDIMLKIFREYRPAAGEQMDLAAAKTLAERWLEEARLNLPNKSP